MVDRRETSGVPAAVPDAVPDAVPASGSVRVHYWAGARDAAGVETEEVAGSTLGDVLSAALRIHPRLAPILRVCSVFVNGEQVPGAGPRAAAGGGGEVGAFSARGHDLAAGSTVEILPPFAGG